MTSIFSVLVTLLSLTGVIVACTLMAGPLLRHTSGRPKSKPIFMAAVYVTAVGFALICWAVGRLI